VGPGPQASKALGSRPKISIAVSGGRYAATIAQTAVWQSDQAVLASAFGDLLDRRDEGQGIGLEAVERPRQQHPEQPGLKHGRDQRCRDAAPALGLVGIGGDLRQQRLNALENAGRGPRAACGPRSPMVAASSPYAARHHAAPTRSQASRPCA